MRMTWRLVLAGAVALGVGGMFWLTDTAAAAAGDDLTGVVQSASGPEAGVWVIAETSDLETRFRKIVVTDDAGRFLVPDLPPAAYEVWVRGYGLVDSDKTAAGPGDDLSLTATSAATPQAAAEVYPANYWYSLLEIPAEDQFPGTGPRGNGIGENMLTQSHWVDRLKDGCQLCHQMGNKATREMPMLNLREFDSTLEAWQHRVQAGGSGPSMLGALNRMGSGRALSMYADWTDRILAGEVPPAPPRPQGIERNVVLSMWGWGGPRVFIHDEITTDKRNPSLNANGPVYGLGGGSLVITDPVAHQSTVLALPARVMRESRADEYIGAGQNPSLYWGDEPRPGGGRGGGSGHNPMMDHRGRVWLTQSIRPGGDNPEWCLGGSDHPSAAYFPVEAEFSTPPAVVLRPRDRQLRADRHLLRHAPSAVCRRRERHALVERRYQRRRVAEYEDVRRDRGRAGVAGVVPDGAGHQRRRQDHEAVERPWSDAQCGAPGVGGGDRLDAGTRW